MPHLQVLCVASEVSPWVRTGSLADAVAALPDALWREGVGVRTLVPGYPDVMAALESVTCVGEYSDVFGSPARLLDARAGGLNLLVLEAARHFDRPGHPYATPAGSDWPDNPFRFAAFSRAAADLALGIVDGYRPDVVHCHDWQSGLALAYLESSGKPRPATVISVHNLACQGLFPKYLMPQLALPWDVFTMEGVEFHGQIGFLKAGLRFADRITTVSPTYAAEIRTPAGGMGLDGLLQARAPDMTGILDGIDIGVWNPATDRHLPHPFNAARFGGRADNKAALQARMGLPVGAGTLLLGVVSRLACRKGIDLLLTAIPAILAEGAQLVLLGSGDRSLEEACRAMAAAHPDRIVCVIGHDEGLAHQILGGADAILVPSRFEPCGRIQLRAMRYGAVPVVARVGGLADGVIDSNEAALGAGVATGIQFAPVEPAALAAAIRRLAQLFRKPETWLTLQRNGMKADVSWRTPARRYAGLYRDLLASRRSNLPT